MDFLYEINKAINEKIKRSCESKFGRHFRREQLSLSFSEKGVMKLKEALMSQRYFPAVNWGEPVYLHGLRCYEAEGQEKDFQILTTNFW